MTPIYEFVNKTKSGPECLGTVFFISCIPVVFSIIFSSSLALLDFKRNKTFSQPSTTTETTSSADKPHEKIKITDVLRFPLTLWLVYAICVTFYCTLFPFITISKLYFISKYGFDPSKAAGVSR